MPAYNTDLLRKKKSMFISALTSSITPDDVVIPCEFLTGIATDTAVTLTLDRVDQNGARTTNKVERVTGIVSGDNLINCIRGADNTTPRSHAAGCVVEDIWDSDTWNDSLDWALVQHNQDGTHKGNVLNFTPLGAYDNSTTYLINSVVTYLGSSYVSKSTTIGNLPTDTDYWWMVSEAGTDGSTWSQGTSVPDNGSGKDGDFYLKTDTSDVYYKASGSWSVVANIEGPQGIQGIQGIQGNQGPAGTNGTNGSDGADGVGVPTGGTTGQVLKKKSNTDYDTEFGDLVAVSVTTKGDIQTFSTTPDRLAVGSNNKVLMADSSEATGLKWADASAVSIVSSEVPSGTIDGDNTDFTLSSTPVSGSVRLYQNGVRLKVTEDYTISGTSITFNTAPPTGDLILADYLTSTGTFATGSTSFINDETPSGTVNGTNTDFTLAFTPVSGSLMLYRDGQLMKGGGADYTLSGTGIAFTTAPETGSVLTAFYQYAASSAGNADTLDGEHLSTIKSQFNFLVNQVFS